MAIFGTNNRDEDMAKPPMGTTAPHQINMVGEGTVFDGTLTADSDVRVSGRIIGTLRVKGRAIIAQEGEIEGEIEAEDADVAGRVKGNVRCTERLVLRNSAHIDGNIHTARLIVEEGATFDGECTMGTRTVKSADLKPIPTPIPAPVAEPVEERNGTTKAPTH